MHTLNEHTPSKFTEMLQINQDAFEAGQYSTAYQALAVVLYCAYNEKSLYYCSVVEQTALRQGQWIDQYAEHYIYSETYFEIHGLKKQGIFNALAQEAKMVTEKVQMRHYG